MYNTQRPDPEDLPSTEQLLKSTAIAIVVALIILVTMILPAEYGIDPTRIGRLLGLTEMGEIKSQLTEEAELDRQTQAGTMEQTGLIDGLPNRQETAPPATSPQAAPVPETPPAPEPESAAAWTDEFSFTLAPDEGIEWKLVMQEGDVAKYRWSAEGGRVNYDLHGDGSGQSITYSEGRGVSAETGKIVAAFSGNHGWFWRNRENNDVTVTVRLRGGYSELKRTY